MSNKRKIFAFEEKFGFQEKSLFKLFFNKTQLFKLTNWSDSHNSWFNQILCHFYFRNIKRKILFFTLNKAIEIYFPKWWFNHIPTHFSLNQGFQSDLVPFSLFKTMTPQIQRNLLFTVKISTKNHFSSWPSDQIQMNQFLQFTIQSNFVPFLLLHTLIQRICSLLH